MKKISRFFVMMTVLLACVLSMSVQVYATTNNLCDGNVSVTDSANTGKGDESTYTITAKGGLTSKKTNNITITNESEESAIVSFTYTVSKASSFTFDGATVDDSGDYSRLLGAGESISISITSKSGFSNLTVTLTLTNIEYTVKNTSSNVTFDFDESLGTVTVDGTNIASGETVEVEPSASISLAAVCEDSQFVGWVNATDNSIISLNAEVSIEPIGDMAIRAVFSNGTPCFVVDDKYMFADLNDATSMSGAKKIVLACNGTLPAGDYTIPVGKTLLIPFDANNTIYNDDKNPAGAEGYTKPKVYRTLTMASGAAITVNGELNISANHSCKINHNGMPTVAYGQIAMNSGSSITVNDGGKLYAWGYITGAGEVTAKSGATVYEYFQVKDYRGGEATVDIQGNSQKVFPMSQYYVQNIEVPLRLEAGAVENGYMSVYVTLLGIQGTYVPFIGPDGMFEVTDGYIIKDYDEATDRLIIDINGSLKMKKIEIKMKVTLVNSVTLDSSQYILAINGNVTMNVNPGSNVSVTNDMALLPGGIIKLYEGAVCTFENGAKAIIYDSENWGGYCAASNRKFWALDYAPGRKKTRSEADLVDAEVYIEGDIDASAGFVYTTSAGANIHAGEGASVTVKPEYEYKETYQAVQTSVNGTDKIDRYVPIPVTTAYLKNADGTYVDPEVAEDCCRTLLTYEYIGGEWVLKKDHFTEYSGQAATCEEAGWNDYTVCTYCGDSTYEEIPAAGHNCTEHPGQAATCESAGWKDYQVCGTCGYSTYEEIPATGHSYGDCWVEDGYDVHKKVCINDSEHVITESHELDGFDCPECGYKRIITSTEYSMDGDNIVIDSQLTMDIPENYYVITVAYDSDGRMIDMCVSTAALLDKVTLSGAGVSTVKICVWNNLIDLLPLSYAEEIAVK